MIECDFKLPNEAILQICEKMVQWRNKTVDDVVNDFSAFDFNYGNNDSESLQKFADLL